MDRDSTADASSLESLFGIAAQEAARFRAAIPGRPQRPDQTYSQAVSAFDAPTPETGLSADHVINDLVERATPGLHATTRPRFFGW